MISSGAPGAREAPRSALPRSALERMADGCAWAVLVLGAAVMLGWWLGNEPLKRVWPGFEAMRFGAALTFLLAGAALAARRRPALRRALAVLVLLVALVMLAQRFVDPDFALESLFLPAGEPAPRGGMAPFTAVYLLLCGTALFLLGRARRCVEILALTAMLGGAVGFLGYVFGVPILYQFPGLMSMAVHTTMGFLLLGGGILLSVPDGTVPVVLAARGSGRPIWLGFVALICLLAVVGVMSLAHLSSVASTAREENRSTWPRFVTSRQLEVNLVHYADQLRAHMDGSPRARGRSLEEAAAVARLLGDYERLIETSRQRVLADRFRSLWEDLSSLGNAILNGPGPPEGAHEQVEALTDRLRAFLHDELEADAVSEQQLRHARTFRRVQSAQTLLFGLVMGGMALAFIAAGAFARQVIGHQTRIQKSEELARDRLTELELLYQNAPIGLCILDREMRFRRINQRFAEINGVPMEQHIGRTVRELLPSLGDQAEAMFRGVMDTGQPLRFEVRGETPAQPGVQRTWDEHWYPWTNAAGEIEGVGVVAEEITERRKAEAAARDAERRKDTFLATLAHELRTPLAPIRNAAKLLQARGPADPALERAQDIIRRQVAHMARLIDDLLDVNRISQGKLELRKEQVDLGSILRNALEAARAQIESVGLEAEMAPTSTPLVLEADPVRLAQVFSNLVNNAVKYSRPGGHIRLSAERQGESVVARVQDDGIGIRPDQLPRVFEMFAQMPAAEGTAAGGLGIGLALVRGLVERHGGTVEAHSDGPDRGSTFTVRLPADGRVRVENHGPAPAFGVARVLVADGHVDEAMGLALLLRMNGCEAELAHDGFEALRMAEASRPGAILVDLGLPRMDGYAVCRAIREHPWGRNILIVALADAASAPAEPARWKEAGFDAHLPKPIERAALSEVLSCRPAGEQGAAGA